MKKYTIDSILQRKLNNLVEKQQSLQRESKIYADSLGPENEASLREQLTSLQKELRSEYYPVRGQASRDGSGKRVMVSISPGRWKKEQSETRNKISKISEKLAIAERQRSLNLAAEHLGRLITQFKQALQTFDPASNEAQRHLQMMAEAFKKHHSVLSTKRPRSSTAKFFDSLRPGRPTHTVELITDFLDRVKKLTEGGKSHQRGQVSNI